MTQRGNVKACGRIPLYTARGRIFPAPCLYLKACSRFCYYGCLEWIRTVPLRYVYRIIGFPLKIQDQKRKLQAVIFPMLRDMAEMHD